MLFLYLSTSNFTPFIQLVDNIFFWLNQNGDTLSVNPVVSNLGAGDYQLKVEDTNGCNTEQFFTIVEPALIQVQPIIQSPNCPNADGIITINEVSGGLAPYTIEWSNGVTTLTNSGLINENYTYTITDSNGCNYSETIDIACSMSTSLEELGEQQQVLIYPNPTVNDLSIQFPETLKIESNIKLLTLTGQLLQNWTISKGIDHKKINLENRNPGIYLIEISMDNAIYREKIIKL